MVSLLPFMYMSYLLSQDDRERDSSVHQRIEKKWLGSLKIPFTTIYFNGKVV